MKCKILLFFILLFGALGCFESKIDCSYEIFEKYDMVVTNKVNDLSLNDYYCNRTVVVTEKKTDYKLKVELADSERCSFFVVLTEFNNEAYLVFNNEHNSLVKIVNLRTKEEVVDFRIQNSILNCNCNELNCDESIDCLRIEVCSYDF